MGDSTYRLLLAQVNPLVGDLTGNRDMVIQCIQQAEAENARVIVFPELVLTGYPPEDLLFRQGFIDQCSACIDDIASHCHHGYAIVGAPAQDEEGRLYNAAYVLHDGKIKGIARKQHLPNYSVFDERRYFIAGDQSTVIDIGKGIKVGISICEDIWYPGPAEKLSSAGANLIVNLNASPFHVGKHEQRLQTLKDKVEETGLPVVYVNLTGGQDELVFDGSSLVVNSDGRVSMQAPAFEEGLYGVELSCPTGKHAPELLGEQTVPLSETALLYAALVSGVRDYVTKNGFSGAILGLSGGIDSALTLAIAVDALGPGKVTAVMMPSRYTADMSVQDAQSEAEILGVDYHVIPIKPGVDAFDTMLSDVFSGATRDTTEENVQARTRGVILMAISNKQGRMLLTTGNKSEMAVGYATLYGDMAGGFAPLKDVYKTKVYELCCYRNEISPVIPERVLERPPTAELAPDQLDQDSLPPYEILDDILQRYIERDDSMEAILQSGFDKEQVKDALRRVDFNEYKRRQAPPGIKVTERAFGRDRRYPITGKKSI